MSASSENYELQSAFLRARQQDISNRLFELGIVSRIVSGGLQPRGAVVEVEGLAQLDVLFVPSRIKVRHGQDSLEILQLAALRPDRSAVSYFQLGRIDQTSPTVHPYEGVDEADADEVLAHALDLSDFQADGTLPNLTYDLLDVLNPNQMLQTHKPE